MEMDVEAIQGLIPHRPPLLLVDRVEEVVPGQRIVATKRVATGPWLGGTDVGLPGSLVLEAMAQCGGILALRTLGYVTQPQDTRFYFLGVEDCRFERPVRAGDPLRIEVEILRGKGRVFKLKGRASVGETLICEAGLTLAQQTVAGGEDRGSGAAL